MWRRSYKIVFINFWFWYTKLLHLEANHCWSSTSYFDWFPNTIPRLDNTKNCFSRGNTVWRVSKYRVFSGPYFPIFELNAKIYPVSFRIHSKYWKIRTRKNSLTRHFLRSVNYWSANQLTVRQGKIQYNLWHKRNSNS